MICSHEIERSYSEALLRLRNLEGANHHFPNPVSLSTGRIPAFELFIKGYASKVALKGFHFRIPYQEQAFRSAQSFGAAIGCKAILIQEGVYLLPYGDLPITCSPAFTNGDAGAVLIFEADSLEEVIFGLTSFEQIDAEDLLPHLKKEGCCFEMSLMTEGAVFYAAFFSKESCGQLN